MGYIGRIQNAIRHIKNKNNNIIYKKFPSDFFAEPELAVAKAIRKDNTQQIADLINNNNSINVNATGNHGMTLLGWACAHRSPKSVEKLLELNADPNLEIIDGDSKIHLVAITASGVNDKVFELLLDYNGNPNGRMDGAPAIFKTIYARRLDRLKLLVKKGADIDIIDQQTYTSPVTFCGRITNLNMPFGCSNKELTTSTIAKVETLLYLFKCRRETSPKTPKNGAQKPNNYS